MLDKFLKIAGVKSEEEFLQKYPTEEAFFITHPQMRKMQLGGPITPQDRNNWENMMTGWNTQKHLNAGQHLDYRKFPDAGYMQQYGVDPNKIGAYQQDFINLQNQPNKAVSHNDTGTMSPITGQIDTGTSRQRYVQHQYVNKRRNRDTGAWEDYSNFKTGTEPISAQEWNSRVSQSTQQIQSPYNAGMLTTTTTPVKPVKTLESEGFLTKEQAIAAKKARGGNPDSWYAQGGGPFPPVFVDSPSDPRYRAYQDSLNMYKLTEFGKRENPVPNRPSISYEQYLNEAGNDEGTEFYRRNKIKPNRFEVSFFKKENQQGNTNYNLEETYYTPIFKKPVQPVMIAQDSHKMTTSDGKSTNDRWATKFNTVQKQQRPDIQMQPIGIAGQQVQNMGPNYGPVQVPDVYFDNSTGNRWNKKTGDLDVYPMKGHREDTRNYSYQMGGSAMQGPPYDPNNPWQNINPNDPNMMNQVNQPVQNAMNNTVPINNFGNNQTVTPNSMGPGQPQQQQPYNWQQWGQVAAAGAQLQDTVNNTAEAFVDFFGNRKANRELQKRNQWLGSSENMYKQSMYNNAGNKGDYVTTGTSYGAYRPQNQTFKGMYANGGKMVGEFGLSVPFTALPEPTGFVMPAGTQMPVQGASGPVTPINDDFTADIVRHESNGNYKAVNPNSSAAGKYQFLWKTWKPKIQAVTGIGSKQDFLNSPEAQEQFYSWYQQNEMLPAVQRLKVFNSKGLTDGQLAKLYHFKGEKGAIDYLKTGSDKTRKNNTSINNYISYKEGGTYELDEMTIAAIENAGGKIKFID